MSTWAEIDEWADRQHRRRMDLNFALIRFGWLLVATNDGTFGARRVRPGENVEVMWLDGEPEATGATPEILVATVRALVAKDRERT